MSAILDDSVKPRADGKSSGYVPTNYPSGGQQTGNTQPPNPPPPNPPPPDLQVSAAALSLAATAAAIAGIALASVPDIVSKIPPDATKIAALEAVGLDPFDEANWDSISTPPDAKAALVEGKFFENKTGTLQILMQALAEKDAALETRDKEIVVRLNLLIERVNYLLSLVTPPIITPGSITLTSDPTQPLTKL